MRLLQAPHLRLTAAGIALLFAFSAVYLAAFNAPRPHDVRVAVVGGPSALRDARATVDPRRFYAVPYDSEQAAREALLEDRVRGILTLERGAATVTVASAYGMPAAQAVEHGLTAVADQKGVAVRVVDARPLPEHDARGLSSFFTVMGAAIASLVFAVLLTTAGRALTLRERIAACATVAIAGGVTVAFSTETVVGALAGPFLGVAGILGLLIAGIVLVVHGLGRSAGPPGLALGGAVFLLVGTSSAGGGVTYQLQPGFYRAISQLLPNGAATTAVRNEVYFGGAHTLGALIVLAAWAAAGALLVVLAPRLRGRTGDLAGARTRLAPDAGLIVNPDPHGTA